MGQDRAEKLRIYADFNSCMEDDRGVWCWLLRYDGKLLEQTGASLDLQDGLPVTLYYEDPEEQFEVDAVLGHIEKPDWSSMWMALPDWNTYRRFRG